VLRAREKDGGADGVAPAPAPVAADAPTSGNAT